MILLIILLPIALFLVNGILFPKTKGFLQPLKVPFRK